MFVIQLDAVSKKIHDRLILEDVSLDVPAGAIYGIRGPNGAGKSMLLRIVCGLVIPTNGTVRVFGQVIGKDREFPDHTGALIDAPGFLPHHSGRRNLELLAMIRRQIGPDEVRAAIRRVGLDPDDRRPVRQYSTGMRQRLGLAQAIMEHPKLLVLDEPTRGIDVNAKREIYAFIDELARNGLGLIVVSSELPEVLALADRVMVLCEGRKTAEFTRAEATPEKVLAAALPDRNAA